MLFIKLYAVCVQFNSHLWTSEIVGDFIIEVTKGQPNACDFRLNFDYVT